MYYQAKFGGKRISSWKDTVDIVIFVSYELLHNDLSQYKVWKQNDCDLEDNIWTNINILTFTVTLTLNAVIHFSSQDILAYDDVSSDEVWLPWNQNIVESHMSPRCDLHLEESNNNKIPHDTLAHDASAPYHIW